MKVNHLAHTWTSNPEQNACSPAPESTTHRTWASWESVSKICRISSHILHCNENFNQLYGGALDFICSPICRANDNSLLCVIDVTSAYLFFLFGKEKEWKEKEINRNQDPRSNKRVPLRGPIDLDMRDIVRGKGDVEVWVCWVRWFRVHY